MTITSVQPRLTVSPGVPHVRWFVEPVPWWSDCLTAPSMWIGCFYTKIMGSNVWSFTYSICGDSRARFYSDPDVVILTNIVSGVCTHAHALSAPRYPWGARERVILSPSSHLSASAAAAAPLRQSRRATTVSEISPPWWFNENSSAVDCSLSICTRKDRTLWFFSSLVKRPFSFSCCSVYSYSSFLFLLLASSAISPRAYLYFSLFHAAFPGLPGSGTPPHPKGC